MGQSGSLFRTFQKWNWTYTVRKRHKKKARARWSYEECSKNTSQGAHAVPPDVFLARNEPTRPRRILGRFESVFFSARARQITKSTRKTTAPAVGRCTKIANMRRCRPIWGGVQSRNSVSHDRKPVAEAVEIHHVMALKLEFGVLGAVVRARDVFFA